MIQAGRVSNAPESSTNGSGQPRSAATTHHYPPMSGLADSQTAGDPWQAWTQPYSPLERRRFGAGSHKEKLWPNMVETRQ
jgi:hypothetical protein